MLNTSNGPRLMNGKRKEMSCSMISKHMPMTLRRECYRQKRLQFPKEKYPLWPLTTKWSLQDNHVNTSATNHFLRRSFLSVVLVDPRTSISEKIGSSLSSRAWLSHMIRISQSTSWTWRSSTARHLVRISNPSKTRWTWQWFVMTGKISASKEEIREQIFAEVDISAYFASYTWSTLTLKIGPS